MKTPEQLRNEFWKHDIDQNNAIIFTQYQEIKNVLENFNMDWCEQQYRKIKKHAIEQTEFYKNYSVDDSFPVMNKDLLMKNKDACTARSGYQLPIHISSTSGSTGTPFSVAQDFKKRNRNIADLKVFGELCDYPSHERMVFFRVLSEKLHRTQEQEERENIFYVDSSDLSPKHLEEMLQVILDKKPRIVFSYSSTLVELGKYILSAYPNKKDREFSMKTILTGGEGISEENRLMLQNAFGCKVYRRYSDMELGILGQDMGDGGAYLLNWGSYYFECLKMNSDEPAEDGEVGRIVITDLFNLSFPMIRYDTGDLGVMSKNGGGRYPALLEIHGRVRDCVWSTSGNLISPAKIFVTMWGQDGVKQWQLIQEDQKLFVMKLNAINNFDCASLETKLKSVLGDDADIQFQFVDEIPVLSSNKRRAVICNYKK